MPKQISFNISGFIFLTFCLLSSCLSCYAKTNGGTEITNTDYMTHNDSLVMEIIEVYALDQGIRDSAVHAFDEKSIAISRVDSICFSKAIMFIKKYGWPTKKMLGKYAGYEPAQAGFMPIMLHHPKKMVIPEIHDLLVKEVQKGNLNPKLCALFFDKYWVCYQHKSLYNTSFKAWTKYNGVLREDKKQSDELLKELGLDVLKDSDFIDK